MTLAQLLQQCEEITYTARQHFMVDFGRLAISDASARETITLLAQGDVYQRLLAVQSCYGSRNASQVLQALNDPSRRVRSLALHLAPLVCSDSELRTALTTLPEDMREVLLRYLYKQGKQTVIDAYFETLVARLDDALKRVLSFGSRAIVTRYLEQVVEQFDLVDWKRFARRYPDLVVTHLRTRVATAETVDPRLVLQINTVLSVLAHHAPDQAIDLIRSCSSAITIERLNLQTLVCHRPNEIADVLLQTGEQSSRLNFSAVAPRLENEHLLALFTRYPNSISNRNFAKLRPQQRLAVYTTCARGWRNSEGILPYHVAAALPTEQRYEEGRRHVALPALVTRPQQRFPYAALLPWDEALAFLNTPLRSPDADLRGVAINALIAATRYQRTHLVDMLQFVRNRRNEQDPVRRSMLSALADLPHGMWQTEHLDDLAQIFQDALNATDLSSATVEAMGRLVVHLFRFYPEWAASQMALLYSKRGWVNIFSLDSYLSDTAIQHLAPRLMPILQAWQRRESERLLVTLAAALGRRLRVFDELAALLETTLEQTLQSGIADSILRLLLKYQHARASLLIPQLLQADKSAITLQPVYLHLHYRRQDLLTPFLGQHAYKGRFNTGRTRFVLPLNRGFQRWTPTQQELFARTLLEIMDEKDQHRANRELLMTIRSLAAMPFINPAPLIQFASDERQWVREVTLRILGKLDAGQGIPTLLDALNDDRARIAIYALRSALIAMPKTEALHILNTTPLTQVTVAKEVVRLIGDLSSDEAYHALLLMEARDLHRDVRVALLRALWVYTERPETWDIFTRAAQSSDTAIARGVVHIPADGMLPATQKRLVSLVATLLAHPEPEVRINALQRCSQDPLPDDEHLLFARFLALLNSSLPDECTKAARAVFALYMGEQATLVGEAMRNLLENRRALQTVAQTFFSTLQSNRQFLLPTTRAILAVLADDPLTITLRVRLIILGLPWEEVAQELMQLVERLSFDAMGVTAATIQRVATMRPDADLLQLETALAASADERLLRLALVALVAQSKQAQGWSDEAIARLQKYREDPSPMVAEAAQFTFPA